MFIKHVQMNNKSDYLKDGQIFINGRYGLLRYKAKTYELNYAAINYRKGGKSVMAKEKVISTESDSKAEKERKEIIEPTSESAKMESVKQTELMEQVESVYTIEELSANARQLFDVRTECAIAALKAAAIKACTISKAKEIIKKFMEKEVL